MEIKGKMKIALVVNRVSDSLSLNLAYIKDSLNKCGKQKVDIVLFPEATLTGLINNDDPKHDLFYTVPIPGEITERLCKISMKYGFYTGIGLLERDGSKIYDTAILIAPNGQIILKYRRVSKGWHGPNADPEIYCEGKELKKVQTSYGTFSFLICGDLFDSNLVEKVKELKPDWLLYPFARSFAKNNFVKEQWNIEKKEYIKQIKTIGITTFMVNYYGTDGTFGGAMVVSEKGEIITEMDLQQDGILYCEL